MKIAQVAKESNYLESYTKWCQTALEVAKMIQNQVKCMSLGVVLQPFCK